MAAGYKQHLVGGKIVDGVAVAGTKYSTPVNMQNAGMFSIYMRWTSTSALNATATLQVCNIPNPDEATDTDWEDDSSISFTAVTGSSLSEYKQNATACGGIYRVKYVNGSGTGTLDAWLVKKEL